ncbi:MAG: hypothetical protein MUF49_31125, partial [Oculatellaceae cyanobacterium Prado106]|nr:hypothetical protein [Oculatellaceae cyanobacterium Prado106]
GESFEDLLSATLSRVQAATLLIVGGEDFPMIGANEDAMEQLQGMKQLAIMPGASHEFEEPGALEEVVRLASEWFRFYLCQPHSDVHPG